MKKMRENKKRKKKKEKAMKKLVLNRYKMTSDKGK